MENYPPEIKIYSQNAKALFGSAPRLDLLLEDHTFPFAHEAGVFVAKEDALYVTSNLYPGPDQGKKHIRISRIQLRQDANSTQVQCSEITSNNVVMPNGGVNYKDGIIFCVQGSFEEQGGIAYMPLHSTKPSSTTYDSQLLITSFHGRPFNSPNDVVVHSDGSIWFTDPIYGWEQGIRPLPRLPNQVYRFDPQTGGIHAVADGFGRPNGICFTPDEKVVYITDTDWIHGDGGTDDTRASSIYAFDVTTYHGRPFLTNRRLFAMADTGIPDGVKCDVFGNVYSGCGDGLNIWSPGGVLLAKVETPGGIANFCFGRNGQVFLLNEYRLWRLSMAKEYKGALLGI